MAKRTFTKYPNNYVKASVSADDKRSMFNYLREIYDEDNPQRAINEIADEYELSEEEAKAYLDEWLGTVLTEYSDDLESEIFAYCDEMGGYTDYDQKVADVSEQWNMPYKLAESYVWNWSIQVNYDDDDEE